MLFRSLNREGNLIFNEAERDNPHMKRLADQFRLFNLQLTYPADGPDLSLIHIYQVTPLHKAPQHPGRQPDAHVPRHVAPAHRIGQMCIRDRPYSVQMSVPFTSTSPPNISAMSFHF